MDNFVLMEFIHVLSFSTARSKNNLCLVSIVNVALYCLDEQLKDFLVERGRIVDTLQ